MIYKLTKHIITILPRLRNVYIFTAHFLDVNQLLNVHLRFLNNFNFATAAPTKPFTVNFKMMAKAFNDSTFIDFSWNFQRFSTLFFCIASLSLQTPLHEKQFPRLKSRADARERLFPATLSVALKYSTKRLMWIWASLPILNDRSSLILVKSLKGIRPQMIPWLI